MGGPAVLREERLGGEVRPLLVTQLRVTFLTSSAQDGGNMMAADEPQVTDVQQAQVSVRSAHALHPSWHRRTFDSCPKRTGHHLLFFRFVFSSFPLFGRVSTLM